MGGTRRWWRIGIGVAAMVVATGCGAKGDGREEAGEFRQQTKAPATTAPPLGTATTVSPTSTDTTVAPRKAPATTVAPVRPVVTTTPTTVQAPPVHDIVQPQKPEPTHEVDNPWAVVSPAGAPAGTRVFMDGTGFTADYWHSHGQVWLSIAGGQSSCYLMALADGQIVIDDAGHLQGSFVVPEKGTCRFSTDEMSTAGFLFDVAYQCPLCFVGTFVVPPADPGPGLDGTHCGTWGYSHGAVQTAEVYADGVSCDGLQPIRDVAWAWAPVTGPQHVDVAGFSCDRVGESIGGAPTATYRCVKGSQSVTLVTTGRS